MSEASGGGPGGRFRRGWTVLLVAATVLVLGAVVTGLLLHRGDPPVALADRLEPPSGAVPTAPAIRAGQVLTRLPAGSAVLSTVSVQPHGYAVEARRLSDGSLWWSYRRPSTRVLQVVRTGPTSAAVLWSDGRLQVLDSLTGRSLWQRPTTQDDGLGESDSAQLQVTAPARGADVPRVVVLSVAGSTQAYDAANGTPLWERPGTVESASSTVVVLRGATAQAGAAPGASATATGSAATSRAASGAQAGSPGSGSDAAAALRAYAAETGAPLGVLLATTPSAGSVPAPDSVVAADAVTLTVAATSDGVRLSAFPPLTAVEATATASPSGGAPGSAGPTGAPDGSGPADSAGGTATTSPSAADISGAASPTATASGGSTDVLTPSGPDLSQPWWQRSFPSSPASASLPPSASLSASLSPSGASGLSGAAAVTGDRLGVAVATPLSDLVSDIAPVVVVVEGGAVSAFTVRTGAPVDVVPRRVPVSGVLEEVSTFRDRLIVSTTGEVVVVGLQLQPPV